jgi:hemerythrin superfamily protein
MTPGVDLSAITERSDLMARKARTKSARKRQAFNAITLLREDHAEVAALFDRYEKGAKRLTDEKKTAIACEICDKLTIHTTIEEEIFYPACQDLHGLDDILAEARVEHQGVKDLIARISVSWAGDDEYDAQVAVLGEYVRHHVKEEHTDLFPKVRKSSLDLNELGQLLASRKAELTSTRGAGRRAIRESGLLQRFFA